jgi:hypothetical protein
MLLIKLSIERETMSFSVIQELQSGLIVYVEGDTPTTSDQIAFLMQ